MIEIEIGIGIVIEIGIEIETVIGIEMDVVGEKQDVNGTVL